MGVHMFNDPVFFLYNMVSKNHCLQKSPGGGGGRVFISGPWITVGRFFRSNIIFFSSPLVVSAVSLLAILDGGFLLPISDELLCVFFHGDCNIIYVMCKCFHVLFNEISSDTL